jgi:uncharacterized protein (DUF4415 family)
MSGRPKFDAEMRRQLAAVDAIPDDQIDLSDIPEITDFSGFVRPWMGKKKSITIRLDEDMLKWFKKRGKGWQPMMNWVLRVYFVKHSNSGVKAARRRP